MNHINLPASCSMMTEDETSRLCGGFELTSPMVAVGVAVAAVGLIGLNLLNWSNNNSSTNFIQDSINAGNSFIQGAVDAGQDFLDSLMGK